MKKLPMTSYQLREKYAGGNLVLGIHEILTAGMKAVSEREIGKNIAPIELQVIAIARDFERLYFDNYNQFKEMVKRCL